MRLRMILALCILGMVLSGCEEGQPAATQPAKKDLTLAWRNDRFEVVSYATFEAGYNDNKREILVITDTDTGRQYLAVTGCGTTELHTVTERHGNVTTTRTEEE